MPDDDSTNDTPARITSGQRVYFGGRYIKLSRKLSQTPWVIDGKRKTESSVEELISEPLQRALRPSAIRFQSAGREDVDVRCLGDGRPFGLELIDSKVAEADVDAGRIEKEINASGAELVQVKCCRFVSKEEMQLLQLGERDKRKTYRAECWTERGIALDVLHERLSADDLQIHQLTPIRVLHRRPLLNRPRLIHSIRVSPLSEDGGDAHRFQLTLQTQAGTYVKEFINGDFGRTRPSVSSLLGCESDCELLDVTAVHLSWPPQLPALMRDAKN